MANAQARATGGPAPIRFRVEGMDCPSCAIKIENALKAVPGVGAVAVNVAAGKLSVTPAAAALSPAAVSDALKLLGFTAVVQPETGDGRSKRALHDHVGAHVGADHTGLPWWRTPKGKLAIAAGALIALAYVTTALFPASQPWPFAIATLIAVVPVARRALAALRTGTLFTIEMLMTIAAMGALVIGAVEEAAVVLFLFAVGELLEGVAAGSARRSIAALSNLAPARALLLEGDTMREVAAEGLAPGALVLVRPGDRFPGDGRVADGVSSVDESPVTGESLPRAKAPGAEVFAGSINLEAALRVTITRAGADNTIARIIRLVEEAQEAKAPVHRFIDRFAAVYMPVVVLIALAVALAPPALAGEPWSIWTYRALALLLIACPCALVISTPAAIAAGLAVGARHGLLVKGGATLETLASVRTAAFDKTGTLTEGRMRVTDICGVAAAPDEVLRLVAGLETGSGHPIARAVLDHAAEKGVRPQAARDVVTTPGRGLTGVVEGRRLFVGALRGVPGALVPPREVLDGIEQLECEGKTVAVVVQEPDILGYLALRDEPRADAARALAALARQGVHATILSGDNARTAQAIARELGVTAHGELLPEDKVALVRRFQAARKGPVALIGDGINDAPALAAADVGVAMGGGTHVALETADAALLRDHVGGVADLIGLARATLSNVRTNVAVAVGSKLVFLVTTVLGLTGMWIAVMADTGATVIVTLNALRLLRFRFDCERSAR